MEDAYKMATEFFFKEKLNLDVTKESDRKKALEWLEKASPNDMFFTEVPDDEVCEFDLISGAMRKAFMVEYLIKGECK